MRNALVLAVSLVVAAGACTTLLGDDFVIAPAAGGAGGAGGGPGSGGEGPGGAGGMPTGDGPQLIGSSPEDAAMNASVSPFGRLFFDRAVSVANAVGKVTMSNGTDSDVAGVEACADGSPSCIRFVTPVYDTTGFNGFTELASREGLDFRRFDIREDGTTTQIYTTDFQGLGAIRRVPVELP